MIQYKELVPQSTYIARLVTLSVEAAVDEVHYLLGTTDQDLDTELPVLWAEAAVAQAVPADQRNHREKTLAKMQSVVGVMRSVIKEGLAVNDQDISDLTTGLMSYSNAPSSVMAYLRGTSNSLVGRKVEPRELINALMVHDEIAESADGDPDLVKPKTTVATIIRVADTFGIDMNCVACDPEFIEQLASSVDRYSYAQDLTLVEEGDITHYWGRRRATTLAKTAIGFAAICETDFGRDEKFEEVNFDYPDLDEIPDPQSGSEG